MGSLSNFQPDIDKFDFIGERLMNAWGAIVDRGEVVGDHCSRVLILSAKNDLSRLGTK